MAEQKENNVQGLSMKQLDEVLNGELISDENGNSLGQYTIVEVDIENQKFVNKKQDILITSSQIGTIQDFLFGKKKELELELASTNERVEQLKLLRDKHEAIIQ